MEKLDLDTGGSSLAIVQDNIEKLKILFPDTVVEGKIDFDKLKAALGDNLEVLKLLQKSYQKQVKMIYIDPPYNTGKEFIYPDNHQDNLSTYLQYTGQKDSAGRKLGTNAGDLWPLSHQLAEHDVPALEAGEEPITR